MIATLFIALVVLAISCGVLAVLAQHGALLNRQTKRNLDELVASSRVVVMTPEQREAQRRSFAFGNVFMSNPNVTVELVNAVADELHRSAMSEPRQLDQSGVIDIGEDTALALARVKVDVDAPIVAKLETSGEEP